MASPIYQSIKTKLAQAGAYDPAFEARIVLEDICHARWSDIIAGKDITPTADQQQKIDDIITRRAAGEPLSRILNQREFWGLSFTLNEATLDPRPDTEILVEKALGFAKTLPAEINILDLGTGTGCIPISLLHELPRATATAADLSGLALQAAQQNANANHVEARFTAVASDWFENISGRFDLITSNPPYIDSKDIANLAPEVKNHDPILALDGGKNGLEPYEIIFSQIKNYLNPQGRAFFEIGKDQCGYIQGIAEKYRIRICGIYPDYAGILRVVEISCGDK